MGKLARGFARRSLPSSLPPLTITITRDDQDFGEWYRASCPEFPEAHASDSTEEEARESLRRMIAWFVKGKCPCGCGEPVGNCMQWRSNAVSILEGHDKWLAAMLKRFPHRREKLEAAHRRMRAEWDPFPIWPPG